MVESKFLRNVHHVSYPTAAGVPAAVPNGVRMTPTVGCTDRWGQVPAAAGHGGRIPSVVAHGGRSPSAVGHGAVPQLYKGSSSCCRPLPHSSLTPPNLPLSTLLSTSEVCF
jgi:hypothetical protein